MSSQGAPDERAQFSELRRRYERKENTSALGQQPAGVRFLKIRSLKKGHLRDLLEDHGCHLSGDEGIWSLRESVYTSDISIDDIDYLIEQEFQGGRIENRQDLEEAVRNLPTLGSSVHRDNVNSTIQDIVRDKSIDSIEKLENQIDAKTLPRIKSYIMWSWYNQTTNDLLEETVYQHSKVLPTLRKVHGIDFFLKTDGRDVPFDLKLSYIPQSFFDEARERKGMKSEERVVKDFFKESTETIGGRGLAELIEAINNSPNLKKRGGEELIAELMASRRDLIDDLLEDPKPLCEWLYHDQFPRLFNNNNRFFIILADRYNFEKPWRLKAEVNKIGIKVHEYLDDFDRDSVIDVEYIYDKAEQHRGEYESKCGIVLVTRSELTNGDSEVASAVQDAESHQQAGWDRFSE